MRVSQPCGSLEAFGEGLRGKVEGRDEIVPGHVDEKSSRNPREGSAEAVRVRAGVHPPPVEVTDQALERGVRRVGQPGPFAAPAAPMTIDRTQPRAVAKTRQASSRCARRCARIGSARALRGWASSAIIGATHGV